MALKGHTKIELTNVNTGEVEIYEDDNHVTNALSNLLQYGSFFGFFSGFHLGNVTNTFLTQMTRGLFLFDNTINFEQNPKITMTPGGVNMIGRGCNVPYSGADSTMGSYNTTESKLLYNGHGYQHVWDFNTGQANGKINCACLTSERGAYIGTGTSAFSSDVSIGQSAFGASGHSSYTQITRNKEDMPVRIDYNNNTIIFLRDINNQNYFPLTNYNRNVPDTSIIKTHNLHFRTKRLPCNEISLFEYNFTDVNFTFEDKQTDIIINLPELENIITDDMKQNNTNSSLAYMFTYDVQITDNYLYFYFNPIQTYDYSKRNIVDTKNVVSHIWKINLKTFQVENYYKISNYTNDKLFGHYISGSYPILDSMPAGHSMYVLDDEYILAIAQDINDTSIKKFCMINLNDNSNYEYVTRLQDDNIYTNANPMFYLLNINNKLYLSTNNTSTSSTPYPWLCIDIPTKTISTLNFTSANIPYLLYTYNSYTAYYQYGYIIPIDGVEGPVFCTVAHRESGSSQSYPWQIHAFMMPNMLVTINNLTQEIIKSPEQTMKVTYTIIDDNYKIDD